MDMRHGHPCPGGALAVSMPLGPFAACVRPASKSRFVSFELSRKKILVTGVKVLRVQMPNTIFRYDPINCRPRLASESVGAVTD